MEVMKEHCEFSKPTEHKEFMYPYSSGSIRCKDTGKSEPSEADFEYALCHKEGMDFCTFQGLQYDFGLVEVEFPTGSGRRMAWPTCCSCKKHY